MIEFIDLHTHLLPGVDDGVKNTEHALKLLKLAYDNGTRGVVLTPHYRGSYRKTPQELRERFARFSQAAKAQLPELTLWLGQEIACDPGAIDALAEGRVLSLRDTGYALLEFYPKSDRALLQEAVETACYYGYRPVIAHGERYAVLRRDTPLMDRLLSHGALLQLNADSVLGKKGWAVKHFCHRMLKSGRASFIASDSHDAHHRPPLLQECYIYVKNKYGSDYARQLFRDNPAALLENKDI